MAIKDLYSYRDENKTLVDSMVIRVTNDNNGVLSIQRYDSSVEQIVIPSRQSSFSADENSAEFIENRPSVHNVLDVSEYNSIDKKISGDVVILSNDEGIKSEYINFFGTLYPLMPDVSSRNGILMFNRYEQGQYSFEDEILFVGDNSILRSLSNQMIGSITRTNSKIIEEQKSSLFYQSDELTSIGLVGTFKVTGSNDITVNVDNKRKLIALHSEKYSDFGYADMYDRLYDTGLSGIGLFALQMMSTDGIKNKIGFDIASSSFPGEISSNFSYSLSRHDNRPVKFGFEVISKINGDKIIYDIIDETKTQDADGNDVWTLTRRTKQLGGQAVNQEVNAGTTKLSVSPDIGNTDCYLLLFIQCDSINEFKIEFGV